MLEEPLGILCSHGIQRPPIASIKALRVRAPARRNNLFTFENASLPLSVLSRLVSWMTSVGTEDGLRMPAAQWLSRNSPSAPMEVPTANRDRREEVAT